MKVDDRPIGVFDSGVGGLTVLKALKTRFPYESFVYLGDTARLPYGSKSPHTIRKYGEQVLDFLIRRDVKALVVACNSASTTLPEKEWNGLPLYTVILPGAQTALKYSTHKKIGIMGTRATIQSEAYQKALLKLNPEVELFASACPLLVPLAEEGWTEDPITNLVVFRYLSEFQRNHVDTVIMGCTHYPILKLAIGKVMGPQVHLVDSGEALADQLEHDFKTGRVVRARSEIESTGVTEILCTDLTQQFEYMTYRILGSSDFLTPKPTDLN